MCTSIAMRDKKLIFGRNMDIDYSFGEKMIIMPRDSPIEFKAVSTNEKHYAAIGIGAVSEGYPLFADGMNENGLCIAALKFDKNAFYSKEKKTGQLNLAPYEIIPYILGCCRNISEARAALDELNIIDIQFAENLPLSPLHWHIADKNGSITVEQTADGLKVYENPADILTNNPPFPFHLENIRQYQKLTSAFPETEPSPFGLGFGAIGLPGDYSPASRFVRADFLLRETRQHDITQLFHILKSVSIPEGAVLTQHSKLHKTIYTSCMDAESMTYFYSTYENSRITAVQLSKEMTYGAKLLELPLKKSEDIFYETIDLS